MIILEPICHICHETEYACTCWYCNNCFIPNDSRAYTCSECGEIERGFPQ